jgi:hypothetical protein
VSTSRSITEIAEVGFWTLDGLRDRSSGGRDDRRPTLAALIRRSHRVAVMPEATSGLDHDQVEPQRQMRQG